MRRIDFSQINKHNTITDDKTKKTYLEAICE